MAAIRPIALTTNKEGAKKFVSGRDAELWQEDRLLWFRRPILVFLGNARCHD
jgi:hypothetical protein